MKSSISPEKKLSIVELQTNPSEELFSSTRIPKTPKRNREGSVVVAAVAAVVAVAVTGATSASIAIADSITVDKTSIFSAFFLHKIIKEFELEKGQ